ncbi:MAG: iron-containing alcohol dehydrogenase [Nanoarchaeota archaeon]|nr:iron-containing alcohol dehydrogenase [Nanoarchaeota archaeon]
MNFHKENKELQSLLDNSSSESTYLNNLNIHVGNNEHENIVKAMRKFGERVLFCTGNRAMRHYGFLDIYLKLFSKFNFRVVYYDNISVNPTLKQMEEGLTVAKEFNPDFIFALGGGSVIDTAKVISVGLFGDIWDFVEKKQEIKKAIPIVASATTSGTGSHVTPYAVITNTDTLQKKTLKHDLLLPKMSINDLDIIKYMPKYIIATTGFDVLCHATEVFTRNECTNIAENFCIKSCKSIRENLVSSYNQDSVKNKLGMIYADIYAGIALALIGTHVPHAISHPISARFQNINHGHSLAYITAETAKKLIEKKNSNLNNKFRFLSDILGGSSDFVRAVNNYKQLLGLNSIHTFNDMDCQLIYEDTLGYRRDSVDRSPVVLLDEDIKDIIFHSLKNDNAKINKGHHL